jgi:hypothetical protein
MDDITAAMRAAVRQRRVQFRVDAGGGHAMPVAAVTSTALAARALRLIRRLALGERRRLTFPRTAALLQQLLQLDDTGIPGRQRPDQLVNPPRLRLHHLSQRLHLRGGRITRKRLASRNSPSYAPLVIRWWTPLSKYLISKVAAWRIGSAIPS